MVATVGSASAVKRDGGVGWVLGRRPLQFVRSSPFPYVCTKTAAAHMPPKVNASARARARPKAQPKPRPTAKATALAKAQAHPPAQVA